MIRTFREYVNENFGGRPDALLGCSISMPLPSARCEFPGCPSIHGKPQDLQKRRSAKLLPEQPVHRYEIVTVVNEGGIDALRIFS
jgi:hypothetical protein